MCEGTRNISYFLFIFSSFLLTISFVCGERVSNTFFGSLCVSFVHFECVCVYLCMHLLVFCMCACDHGCVCDFASRKTNYKVDEMMCVRIINFCLCFGARLSKIDSTVSNTDTFNWDLTKWQCSVTGSHVQFRKTETMKHKSHVIDCLAQLPFE